MLDAGVSKNKILDSPNGDTCAVMTIMLDVVSTFSLLLLVCSLPVSVASAKWYYWIEPGVYAEYGYFCESKSEFKDELRFMNGSVATLTNFSLSWDVSEVNDIYATVDYNLTLEDVEMYPDGDTVMGIGVEIGTLTFNTTVTVRLDTLELIEDGKPWGRWPYWVHGWEVDKKITMIHNFPYRRWDDEPVNVTVHLNENFPTEFYVDTSVYNFTHERLLFTSTYPIEKEEGGASYTAAWFNVWYDAVSLIFVGDYHTGGRHTEDIMAHKFGLRNFMCNGWILLSDSNVNFEPLSSSDGDDAEKSPFPISVLLGVIIIVFLSILGIIGQLKRKRR